MTAWIQSQQDNLITIAFTSLGVAIVPDVVTASPMLVDATVNNVTIVKDVVQIIGGILGGGLSVMLICINWPKFKSWIRKGFKRSNDEKSVDNS